MNIEDSLHGLARIKGWLPSLLRGTRLIFTPLSLLVIALLIWQARSSLSSMAGEGEAGLLLTALFLWMLGNVLVPAVSTLLFRSCAQHIDYRSALDIHCSRLPAKYLPGGIWHSVGRANDYLAAGFDPHGVGLYFVVENFLLVAVTMTLSSGIVAPLVALPLLDRLLAWAPFLLGALLLVFPASVRMLTKGKRVILFGPYIGSVAIHFAYWCVVGLAFAAYISAFDGLTLDATLIESAAVYVFSWCLGYLALFAPQGIGVSEFISSSLLGGGVAELLAFLIGFRVLVLIADLLCWGFVAVVKAMEGSGSRKPLSGEDR